jgi:hypothetical protein
MYGVLLGLAFGACCQAQTLRKTISLDGRWQIAEGTMTNLPASFERSVPMPGLVDMTSPAFEEVGVTSAKREAFWYRRTFKIEQSIPAVARLKLHKAMFGCKVIVNGKTIGEQKVTFTPVYFDVKDVLRHGENEILIRVGAWLPDGKASIGWDQEKTKYIPGIFDSVEVILSGVPHIDRVQAVPDIEKRSVTIHAWPAQPAHFIVRESRSQKVVGEADGMDKVTIPIPDCRLWSPEDPFLYEVSVRTAGDELSARFGMRSFRLDPQTGHAVLNGKPYFMRGSNITLYRFFEDEKRGSLPWNEEWVRKLHRRCKEMHWNSLRYSIGFPPEFWYRIADEEGILIQDEFPIWMPLPYSKPGTLNIDELAGYYRDWMQERWNHPCVVIWGACNETDTRDTDKAFTKVRGLDFSDRPWSNWAWVVKPTDARDQHTYHFNDDGNYNTLEILRFDTGTHGRKPGSPCAVVNEYGWLWLNRDGTPTLLTKTFYSKLLGPNSTAEERFTLQARYLAAETEFWRAKRGSAAVMHFCALAYSRPDGYTSDNWSNVEKLEFEPLFYKYVRDSFAPIGLMVDNFVPEQHAEQMVNFPVVVFSDLATEWKGQVHVEFSREGKMITEKTLPVALDALGKTELACPLRMPGETGAYQVKATLLNTPVGPVSSLRDFTVTTPEQQRARYGLAFGKPATASSCDKRQHWSDLGPAAAVDGSLMTFWEPTSTNYPQWVAVDLQSPCMVGRIELTWQNPPAQKYVIELSSDGKEWTELYKTNTAKGAVQTITIAPSVCRWLRLYFPDPQEGKTGCQLRDFKVLEK